MAAIFRRELLHRTRLADNEISLEQEKEFVEYGINSYASSWLIRRYGSLKELRDKEEKKRCKRNTKALGAVIAVCQDHVRVRSANK
jgi:hypothetical protein